MFYRLTLIINTTSKVPVNKLREQVEKVWPLAETINPGTELAEPSTIALEKCKHDEHPPGPCELIFDMSTSLLGGDH